MKYFMSYKTANSAARFWKYTHTKIVLEGYVAQTLFYHVTYMITVLCSYVP